MKGGETRVSVTQAKQARDQVLCRQRRILFNDDGEEMAHPGADTREGFLAPRLKPLIGTQVDTICWSILSNWGDAPSYDSKIQPIHGDASGGAPPEFKPYTENFKALIKVGLCPLQMVIDFAHDNQMELFASVRMNDVHDSFVRGLMTTWKREHPELLVETEGMLPDKRLYITAQDYSHEAVRQRKHEIFEEVCQRYDVDGFELDFVRQPVFFSRTMRGEPVTAEEIEIITAFLRRIRKLTDETGRRRGRPILLAARVPDSFELSLKIGLDIKEWLNEDLVDILIQGGGYAPFSLPVAEFAKEAHKHGVNVYPCNNSPSAPPEVARALASKWYDQAADGIYFWNLGVPLTHPTPKIGQDLIEAQRRYYAPLGEVGDPETLAGKENLFSLDGPVLHHYAHISSRPPLPISLEPGTDQRLSVDVAADVAAVNHNRLVIQLKLPADFSGTLEQGLLLVRLNGELLESREPVTYDAETSACQVTYRLGAPPLKKGQNVVLVRLLKHDVCGLPCVVQVEALRLYVMSSATPNAAVDGRAKSDLHE